MTAPRNLITPTNALHIRTAATLAQLDAVHRGLSRLGEYLRSDKFWEDPTVQVADVLARLREIEGQEWDAFYEVDGRLSQCDCGHPEARHATYREFSHIRTYCDGDRRDPVLPSGNRCGCTQYRPLVAREDEG